MAIVNDLRIRYAKGYTSVTDVTSISTYGRRRGFLALGQVESRAEAQALGQAEIARMKDPLDQIVIKGDPDPATADTVYLGWDLGDYVTVPSRTGGTQSARVRSIQVKQDDDTGDIFVVPELASRLDELEDRNRRAIQRMINGTLEGRSFSASIPPPAESVTVRRPTIEVIPMSANVTGENDLTSLIWGASGDAAKNESPAYHPDNPGRLAWVRYAWNTPPASDATIDFVIDGTVAVTHTIPASTTPHDEFPNIAVDKGSDITWRITDIDTVATGLSGKAHLVVYE